MSNLGAIRHLGIDQKYIFTILRHSRTHVHQHVKFSHNLANVQFDCNNF